MDGFTERWLEAWVASEVKRAVFAGQPALKNEVHRGHKSGQQNQQGAGLELEAIGVVTQGNERHTRKGHPDTQPAPARELLAQKKVRHQGHKHRPYRYKERCWPGLHRYLSEVEGGVIDGNAQKAQAEKAGPVPALGQGHPHQQGVHQHHPRGHQKAQQGQVSWCVVLEPCANPCKGRGPRQDGQANCYKNPRIHRGILAQSSRRGCV